MDQHGLRQWLVAWRHQAFQWLGAIRQQAIAWGHVDCLDEIGAKPSATTMLTQLWLRESYEWYFISCKSCTVIKQTEFGKIGWLATSLFHGYRWVRLLATCLFNSVFMSATRKSNVCTTSLLRQESIGELTKGQQCEKRAPHDVITWKHFPRYWPFMRGIHQSPMNSPHKGQWRSFDVFFDLRLNKRLS